MDAEICIREEVLDWTQREMSTSNLVFCRMFEHEEPESNVRIQRAFSDISECLTLLESDQPNLQSAANYTYANAGMWGF